VWHNPYDDDRTRLVKPSYPSPPNLEFDPQFPRTVDDKDLLHRPRELKKGMLFLSHIFM